MNIVIRTDASIEIGSGHFMRCLTLAGQLRSKGAAISFLSRELPGNLCGMAEKKGYGVHRLPFAGGRPAETEATQSHDNWLGVAWETDALETQEILQRLSPPAEWLIVDHYALDKRWETRMRPFTKKIMVIDDIADRPHDCDVLLDQNLYPDLQTRYNGLVPAHCKKLLGPSHALLRPEFIEARRKLRRRDGSIKRILIFFGGSDPTNETTKALEAITILNRPDIAVTVVAGNANPHKEQIRQRCSLMLNVIFHGQVENMAELMSQADLAIGGGGTATWERCFLGLPSITLIVAQNQLETTNAVAKSGATWNLGWHEQVSATLLADGTKRAIDNPQELTRMSELALEIMGGAQTLSANTLLNMILKEQYAAS